MFGALAIGFAQITKPSGITQGLPRDSQSRRAERRNARRLRKS